MRYLQQLCRAQRFEPESEYDPATVLRHLLHDRQDRPDGLLSHEAELHPHRQEFGEPLSDRGESAVWYDYERRLAAVHSVALAQHGGAEAVSVCQYQLMLGRRQVAGFSRAEQNGQVAHLVDVVAERSAHYRRTATMVNSGRARGH